MPFLNFPQQWKSPWKTKKLVPSRSQVYWCNTFHPKYRRVTNFFDLEKVTLPKTWICYTFWFYCHFYWGKKSKKMNCSVLCQHPTGTFLQIQWNWDNKFGDITCSHKVHVDCFWRDRTNSIFFISIPLPNLGLWQLSIERFKQISRNENKLLQILNKICH